MLFSAIRERVPAVEERVKQFHDILRQGRPIDELPDVPNILLSDWYKDDVVNHQDFSRQIIRSLKDTDEAGWKVLLDSCTLQQAKLLEEFVEGSKLENIYEQFDFDSTRGSRQEFSVLESLSQSNFQSNLSHLSQFKQHNLQHQELKQVHKYIRNSALS